MRQIISIFILPLIILFTGNAAAGNFGMGVHSGYGVIKHSEQTSLSGDEYRSYSTRDMVIFGVSAEYSFSRPENFYANITTDWVAGREGTETWKRNDIRIQTTGMGVFAQFYDFRIGHKNTMNNFYYSFYVSGGWDGMRFERDRYMWRGTPLSGGVENIHLWRTGAGTGAGYRIGKWAVDGRLAYAWYPAVRVKNSSLPRFTFDTNGTVLDTGFGLAREIYRGVNFYFGGSYSLFDLNESDIIQKDSIQAVYPGSRIEIIAGMLNLTFAF
ncbi:MAG: hypothetical protein GXP46_01105 [Deferribacteres bacterium]|nr:hypothetical protein [Deferribacteres bacterium]